MSGFSKIPKTDRLRKRLFFQYGKGDYTGAARLGEALLRAHIRYSSTHTAAYEDDLYNVALACDAAGRTNRAIELYTDSIHRAFTRSGADLVVAARLTNLGRVLSVYEQHEAACRIFMQALTIRKRFLPPTHLDLGDSLYNAGCALVRAGLGKDAIPALNSAMHIYTRNDSDNLINCLHIIASAYEQMGKYEEAFPFAEAAWRGLATGDGEDHHRAGYYLAGLYEAAGRHQDACELYLDIMGWVERTVGCSNIGYINLATRAASRLAVIGEYRQSRDILQKISKLVEGMVGRNNLTYSNCIRNLVVIHQHLGEWDEAEALLKEYGPPTT